MKIEDQVVSIELAVRLMELGVKQGGEFYWWQRLMPDASLDYPSTPRLCRRGQITTRDGGKVADAFSVAELGELLPIRVNGTILVIGHLHDGWTLQYRLHNSIVHEIRDPKEADARAKLLIYLLENKLVLP